MLLAAMLAQSAMGALVVAPATGLSSSGFAHGPFSPSRQVYTLSNNGIDTLIWLMSRSDGWFSFSATSGTLDPGQSTAVTVSLNALPLDFDVGSYSGSAFFINVSTSETTPRSINLNVALPGSASLSFPSVSTSNMMQIRLTGASGSTFEVQQAADVKGPWASIYTNTFVGGLGSYDVALSGARRFFQSISSGAGAVPAALSFVRLTMQDLRQVIVTGSPLGTYLLEASTNGTDWMAVYTNKTSSGGTFTYTSSSTGLQYRATGVGALSLPTVDHVLIVGDSLAAGVDGNPPLSTVPSTKHFHYFSDQTTTDLTPLFELFFETISSGAANHVNANAPTRRLLIGNVGANGSGYVGQKKGSALYNLALTQYDTAPQVMACAALSYRPRAIFAVAGEVDLLNANYDLDVREWQSDYQKDIQRITGYTNAIPMLHSQFSAWTALQFGLSNALSPFKVLAEAEANPGKTILVGPRYIFPYSGVGANFPGWHLSNVGYRWLGEYYAKVYKKVVVDGGTWTPLKPKTVTRVGAVITVTFDVPAPPLALDTTLVSNPGNFGFEFSDSSGAPPSISSVQITGPTTVTVTLSAVPSGANQRLRYAYTGVPGNSGGPTTGPRGNLRDSDAEASLYGNTLYNWCVHFDKPVN
jgi:hypothetical protein